MKRLPDDQVNVILVECKNCKEPIFTAIQHSLSKEGKKEISELVIEGHSCETMPLLEYRKLEISGWCDSKCLTTKN
jgi:hypothetical protein